MCWLSMKWGVYGGWRVLGMFYCHMKIVFQSMQTYSQPLHDVDVASHNSTLFSISLLKLKLRTDMHQRQLVNQRLKGVHQPYFWVGFGHGAILWLVNRSNLTFPHSQSPQEKRHVVHIQMSLSFYCWLVRIFACRKSISRKRPLSFPAASRGLLLPLFFLFLQLLSISLWVSCS